MTNTFGAFIQFDLHIAATQFTFNSISYYASEVLVGIDAGRIWYTDALSVNYVQYCVLFEENKAVGMLIKTKISDGYNKAERCRGG